MSCAVLCRGDKSTEMRLVGVQTYVSALKSLALACSLRAPLSLFLTTEDASALQQMRRALAQDQVGAGGCPLTHCLTDIPCTTTL